MIKHLLFMEATNANIGEVQETLGDEVLVIPYNGNGTQPPVFQTLAEPLETTEEKHLTSLEDRVERAKIKLLETVDMKRSVKLDAKLKELYKILQGE